METTISATIFICNKLPGCCRLAAGPADDTTLDGPGVVFQNVTGSTRSDVDTTGTEMEPVTRRANRPPRLQDFLIQDRDASHHP